MADPEIGLSRPSNDDTLTGKNVGFRKYDYEGKYTSSPDESARNSTGTVIESPIQWDYLTFETVLPRPTQLTTLDINNNHPPDAPDLKEYGSPFDWSPGRKSLITWLSCIATAVTAYTAGSYTSAGSQMMDYWNVSHVAITVGVTTFTTGFAIA